METKPRFNYTGYGWEGKMYDKDLTIKDIAERVRFIFNKQYQDCKLSVTIQRYSGGQSLNVALMSAPFEVFDRTKTQDKNGNIYTERDFQHTQLNHYMIRNEYEKEGGYCNGSYLTPKGWEIMQFVDKLAESYNFDDSDGQIDYFHCNYYVHLNIGKWDKPFIIKTK